MDHPEYRALWEASEPDRLRLQKHQDELTKQLLAELQNNSYAVGIAAEAVATLTSDLTGIAELAKAYVDADNERRELFRPRMEWIEEHPEYR